MNQDQINKILQDIYAIDDSLEQHEDKLIKIIKQIIESRPDTKFDENFAFELRKQVMERARQLKVKAEPESKIVNLINNMKKKIMPAKGGSAWGGEKQYYMIGAVAIIILLIIPTMYYLNKGSKLVDLGETKLAYEPSITKLADQAFGSLVSEEQAVNKTLQGGGGGIGSAVPAPAISQDAVGLGGGGAATGEVRAIGVPAPEMINYNYVYQGDEIFIIEEQMLVYKKIKSSSASQQLANAISGVDFGLVDLSKFKNTELTNFDITENRDFGYSIYFNLVDSNISINTNWNKWPRPGADCQDLSAQAGQACINQFRLKIEDVPADDNIIAIADQFIKDYGIDMANYGKGEVFDYWRQNYDRAPDKSLAYIPESIPVVYPLMINNQAVYDEGGNKNGITVEVNIRHNKAGGMRGIVAQNYQSSNYEAETDVDKIINFAENGGMSRNYQHPNPSKTVDVELGTPTLALVKIYQHNQTTKQATELYVPSYVFPITKMPEQGYFYQRNIVVPLVKEIIEERYGDIIGIPEPVQLPRSEEVEDDE